MMMVWLWVHLPVWPHSATLSCARARTADSVAMPTASVAAIYQGLFLPVMKVGSVAIAKIGRPALATARAMRKQQKTQQRM